MSTRQTAKDPLTAAKRHGILGSMRTDTTRELAESHPTHCDLCGRKADPFTMEDGYTNCCNELICTSGECATVRVRDAEGRTIGAEHFRYREDAEHFINTGRFPADDWDEED